jgi:hypothetical protein
VVTLAARGAAVMLSNSSAPDVQARYRDTLRRASSLALWQLPARRSINSQPGKRGPITELLLSNLTPRPDELPGGVERLY